MLLCEDNYLNAEIATLLLTEREMQVDWAMDGQQAIELFRSSPEGHFDLILMDIRMPTTDGYEATRQIRALKRADAKIVPIIAMTADAWEEDLRLAKEAGMNDFVTKPIMPEILLKAIAAAISSPSSV